MTERHPRRISIQILPSHLPSWSFYWSFVTPKTNSRPNVQLSVFLSIGGCLVFWQFSASRDAIHLKLRWETFRRVVRCAFLIDSPSCLKSSFIFLLVGLPIGFSFGVYDSGIEWEESQTHLFSNPFRLIDGGNWLVHSNSKNEYKKMLADGPRTIGIYQLLLNDKKSSLTLPGSRRT